jgi:hypothetical protein
LGSGSRTLEIQQRAARIMRTSSVARRHVHLMPPPCESSVTSGVEERRVTFVSRGGRDVEGEGTGDAPGEAGGGWRKRRWGWVREKGEGGGWGVRP